MSAEVRHRQRVNGNLLLCHKVADNARVLNKRSSRILILLQNT